MRERGNFGEICLSKGEDLYLINIKKMNYQLNFFSKRKYFYEIVFKTFFLHIIALTVLLYIKGVSEPEVIFFVALAVFIAWALFFFTPLLLLYLNHKNNSRGVKFRIDADRMFYEIGEESISFKTEEILKIDLVLSPPSFDERVDFLFFGKYHFTTIYLKNGEVLNISCLVFDKTKEVFSKDLIEGKKRAFPFIK